MQAERAAARLVNWKDVRWSSRSLASAGVLRAILVNRPTLDGVYLLLGQAVVISCATGIHAFVFSGVGRQQGGGREICVARIQGSRPQWQKRCEDHADADKVSPAVFQGLAPSGPNHRGLTCRPLCEFGNCKKKYRPALPARYFVTATTSDQMRLHWREVDGRLRQFGNLLPNEHEHPKLAGHEIVHVRFISANPIKLRGIAAAETTKQRSRISMQGSLWVS
jgi:hypothetical protein